MGVPVFFKWMCMRNPKILKDAAEAAPESFDSANPYIDNFYVDMNGLIHPACNPKEQNIKVPNNFQEQCQNIYDYVDKIMNIVRPRKLLYLAIDGVAPRAKMNQQRTRRFRAAMEGLEMQGKKEELLQTYRRKDLDVEQIENYVKKVSFDSNVITPGTPFLDGVGQAIRNYIKERLVTHRLWKNLTVVFSDASCPGEGEHKIMDFIRQQRASASYDPNQHHCIYGADADLIMLGLATHEPRFYIIREIVIQAIEKWCTACGKRGHYFTDCRMAESIEDEVRVNEKHNADAINVSFQFLNLKLVREFLHLMFKRANVPFGYDIERVIDDFVFLCFFVGNDFLPHIPCLTIREGGIDILMKVYEYCLGYMPDYLTNSGEVNFSSLKIFIREMSLYQRDIISEIITKQSQANQREQLDKQNKQKLKEKERAEDIYVDYSNPLGCFKAEIKKLTSTETNLENYSVFSHDLYSYKEKYYKEKFRIKPSEYLQLKKNISHSYLEALSWICKYYYKGVASWSWYYPFHYSPFFSDLDVREAPTFELGEPFKPYEQLMAVLPPKTCHALPEFLRPLMTSPISPIADYFPSEFEIDLLGKKFTWLGEVLLPFIDDRRLLKAMGNYQQKLNSEQRRLNKLGTIDMFVSRKGTIGRKLADHAQKDKQLDAHFEDYLIEGSLAFKGWSGDVEQWEFTQPVGRQHFPKLKEGIEFSIQEELNDDFVRRTDRKAYGGERFVRIIERSMHQRQAQLYSGERHQQEELRRNNSRDSRDDRRGERADGRRADDRRGDDRRGDDRRGNDRRGRERSRSRDEKNRSDSKEDRHQGGKFNRHRDERRPDDRNRSQNYDIHRKDTPRDKSY